MPVVLVGNTRAGRGRAKRLFDTFRAELERAGFAVTPLALGRPAHNAAGPHPETYDPERFRGADAVVAFGGDGTINAVAEAAASTHTPVYHVPTGNENLFARAFGMSTKPLTLINALKTRHVISTDIGLCDDQHFLIMVGFGPDAGVIRRLHALRTRSLGHLAYIEPTLKEAHKPTLQPLTVTADGREIAHARTGWLIIAHNPQYASGLHFASCASPASGTLDVVFMPARNLRDCVNWVLRARLRQHRRDPRLISTQARHVHVTSADGPLTHQLDGEWPRNNARGLEVAVSIRPGVLPVLLP